MWEDVTYPALMHAAAPKWDELVEIITGCTIRVFSCQRRVISTGRGFFWPKVQMQTKVLRVEVNVVTP